MAANIPQASPTPDVEQRPLPTPFNDNRTTPEAFGYDAGQGLQDVGALTNQIATVARDRANTSAVLSARGAADNALNQQILSDQTGFRALKGHDAMGGVDKTLGDFDKSLTDIGSGLSNPEQERAFAHYALSLKQEAFRHVQNHLAQQSNIVDVDAYKTAEAALIGKLGAMPVAMNPADRERQLQQIETTAKARAIQIFGKAATPEEISNFTVPARSKGLDQVLETLLAHENEPGALAEAKRIIADPATAQLLGGARAALVQGRIYRRSDAQEGLGWAQAAVAANRIAGTTLIDDKAQEDLHALAATPGARPEMVKVAESELQRLSVAARQQQKQRNETAYTLGVAAIGAGDNAKLQKALDTLSVPEAEGGGLLKSLYEFRATQAKRDLNTPEAIRAQAAAEVAASDLLSAAPTSQYGSADSFLAQKMPDGRTLAESLSPGGMMKIGAAFERKKEKEAADKPLDSHAMGLVKATLVEALSFPTGMSMAPTDEQIAERNHVVDYVRQKRNSWKESNPAKEPGDEQYQEWITEQVGRVPGTSPHWWSSDRNRVDIELEQAKAAREGQPVAAVQQAAPASVAPAQAAQPAAAPAPTPVKTQADYDAIPPGTRYVGPDGKVATKKKGP